MFAAWGENWKRSEESPYIAMLCSEHLLAHCPVGILSLHLQANETAIRESRIEVL